MTTAFNVWAMRVHQRETGRVVTLPKFDIDRICKVEFTAHPDLFDKIKLNSSWLNSKTTVTKDLVTIDLQTYYSDPLWLSIALDNTHPGFKFLSATFQLHRQHVGHTFALKLFTSTIDGDMLTISRKRDRD